MKQINYFFILLFGLTLFSCTENITEDVSGKDKIRLTQDEILSISYYDSPQLNEADIFNLVKSFMDLDGNETTRSASTTLQIGKKTYINKEGEFDDPQVATRALTDDIDITSPIYEVQLKRDSITGLAVVAADPRHFSIIAYIPNGASEEAMERSGAKDLLNASKGAYLYKAIKTKELVDSLQAPTLQKISHQLNIPIENITYERIKDNIIVIDSDLSTRVTAIPGTPGGVEKKPSSIDPLVKTNWDQGDPYNGYFYTASAINSNMVDMIADGRGGVNRGPVPAGCVNIAMAQMMTHTHLKVMPIRIVRNGYYDFVPDFSHMSKTPKLTDKGVTGTGITHAQWLITELYLLNKTKSGKNDFGWVTDSGVTDQDMMTTMARYFKYDANRGFDGDRVWAGLRNENLTLMCPDDHVFIIDGILITDKMITTRELVKTNDVYWHANFGWGNECTGYYKLDSNANTYFEAGSTTQFCYKMQCVMNVRAK